MANSEESSPLIANLGDGDVSAGCGEKESKSVPVESGEIGRVGVGVGVGWTADGLPLGHGSVVGEPVARARWDSSLFACLGRNDEFCSSDLEVCLLGSVVPCMLYGSNVERLGSGTGAFANHCLRYTALYLLGNTLFGWNCVAPWFSYPSRTAVRRKFNLEGSCEALSRSCGCCGSFIEDNEQREQCETACDFATHFFCHTCSLCQEGRELRRRLPHPGFISRPVLVMIPPMEQTMGR
ncbi:cell number regulator 8-like [Macadamia integrifolia]|uniref:cell number regulator 8-like n=1 Tax=Macadamia integrifolia TaxID=60698 RepID=UPI001C4F6BD5|nr:cell number regulator 8-like [Macadamia integrifolia]